MIELVDKNINSKFFNYTILYVQKCFTQLIKYQNIRQKQTKPQKETHKPVIEDFNNTLSNW